MDVGERQSRSWWMAVGAAALAGLVLRIAAARGGLWTDEAWSVIYAARARDAAGVFLRINHDNNHHLYSLWLQAIGTHASPMLMRLPAIVAGTLSVPLAALVVARRSAWAGIAAAILFAVSPTMVNFGSEARGYALMILAALGFLWLAAEAIEGRERPGTSWWLALVAALGMLSHMTMAAPVGLIALWFYLERRAAAGPAKAMRDAARLMGPALAATAAVVAFVFAAAAASPTGMQLGGYLPFAWHEFFAGLNDMTGVDRRARPGARLGRTLVPGVGGFVDRPQAAQMARRARAALCAADPRRARRRRAAPVGQQRFRPILSFGRDRPAAARIGVDRARLRQEAAGSRRGRCIARGAGGNRTVARFEADRTAARSARRGRRADGADIAQRRPRRARSETARRRADRRRRSGAIIPSR